MIIKILIDKETIEGIRSSVRYDLLTGKFHWRAYRRGVRFKNKEAGGMGTHGYRIIMVNGVSYRVHRLAFIYVLGWVPEEVDHIDRNKLNNSWINLRPATSQQNSWNTIGKGQYKKGVTYLSGSNKYLAQITNNGQNKYLGLYDTEDEAHESYKEEVIKTRGEYGTF